MTDKLSCGACEAKLLALLEAIETDGDDCVCDDFGLWETLCADMLSKEETERLAEHLDVCEDCRQECADAHRLGAYKGSPFYARMDAYKKNPAAESDENWKKIAFAFDPSLAKIVVSQNDADVIIDEKDDPTPTPRREKDNQKASARWRVPGYSAAAALLFAAALTAGPAIVEMAKNDSKPDEPSIIEPKSSDNPVVLPSDEDEATRRGNGAENNEIPSDSWTYEDGAEESPSLSELFENPRVKELDWNEGSKGMGAETQATVAGEKYVLHELEGIEELQALLDCENAVAAFNDGDYKTAAREFGALVETLKASEKVDDKTLNRAYWNWGVATLRSGDKAKAKEIFEALKARKPGDEMNATAEAALEECQN